MKKLNLIPTRGISGSGKSTWAKSEVLKSNGSTVRIEKDELRNMLHFGEHSKGRESLVLAMEEAMIHVALAEGKHVILSNTHLNPKHLERIQNKFGHLANIKTKDFFDVPLEECIQNDLKRFNSVGEKVIRSQWKQWQESQGEKKEMKKLEQDLLLDHALLVDVDGTLAKMTNRSPYEWHKVSQDEVHEEVADIVRLYHKNGTKIVIVSGRDGICRTETEKWLSDNSIPYNELLMREVNDSRKDFVVKEEIFNNHIKGRYYVKFVLDDRKCVVDKWRELGLKCLQVAEGDF